MLLAILLPERRMCTEFFICTLMSRCWLLTFSYHVVISHKKGTFIVFEILKKVFVVDRWIDWFGIIFCSSVWRNVYLSDFTTVLRKNIVNYCQNIFAATFVVKIFYQICAMFIFLFIKIAFDCIEFCTRVVILFVIQLYCSA